MAPDHLMRDWNRTEIRLGPPEEDAKTFLTSSTRSKASTAMFGPRGPHFALEKCEPVLSHTGYYMRKRNVILRAQHSTSSLPASDPRLPLPYVSTRGLSFPEKIYDQLHPFGFYDNENIFTFRVYARGVPLLIVPIAATLSRSFSVSYLRLSGVSDDEHPPLRVPERSEEEQLNLLDDLVLQRRISPQVRQRLRKQTKLVDRRMETKSSGFSAARKQDEDEEQESKNHVTNSSTSCRCSDIIADNMLLALEKARVERQFWDPRPSQHRVSKTGRTTSA
ncbi:unnamed protein product [Amoebophrya sp. A25]|nr:unnamed protein product [Amoebophrya sp. A25]|eukprot:GSA25T00022430001.1